VETGNSKIETRKSRIAIDAVGDLLIQTDGGKVRFHKPVVYQPATNPESRVTASPVVNRQSKIVNPWTAASC